MKKIFLLLSIVAVASLTSCKKDRTCSCTTTDTYPTVAGYSETNTSEFKMTKISKGSAKRGCVKTTTTGNGSSYSTTVDCKLK